MSTTDEILAAIALAVKTAVDIGPGIIKGAEDAMPFATQIYNLFSGATVTQEQLDTLAANIASLSSQLQAPLPPDDGTTTS